MENTARKPGRGMRQNEKSNEEGRDVQIVNYVCGKQTYARMKGTRQVNSTFFLKPGKIFSSKLSMVQKNWQSTPNARNL